MTDSITSLPDESKTAIEIVSLWTSIPIYLVLSIKGCSFPEGLRRTLKTYSKGAPFYTASASRHVAFYPPQPIQSSAGGVLKHELKLFWGRVNRHEAGEFVVFLHSINRKN